MIMKSWRNDGWAHVALAVVVWGLVSGRGTLKLDAAEKPRLVVVVSVDQLRYEYLERFRENFAAQGLFRQIETSGASYLECHHRHAFTLTAPGHAAMLTGCYPSQHGIIDNNWYDRRTRKTVYCIEDANYPIVGSLGAAELKGVSPLSLEAPTVGDVMKEVTGGRARVCGVTLKDRAAIVMAGRKADSVYWYDSTSGCWVTSRYYRSELPAYLRELNASHAVKHRYADKSWELLLPTSRYRLNYPDDSLFEESYEKIGRAFPHPLDGKDEKHLCKQLPGTPYGNEFAIEVARMVIEQEALGADDVPDFLAIGLSSNDYVGHTYGPLSLEVEDITYRTDQLLGQFVRYLDQQVGAGRWTLLLSADHGVAPIPEQAATLGLAARRNPLGSLTDLSKRLELHLRQKFGAPPDKLTYVDKVETSQIYLMAESVGGDAKRFGDLQDATREFLLSMPPVVVAVTRTELQKGNMASLVVPKTLEPLLPPGSRLEEAFQRAFNPARSGDVLFALQPYQSQSTLRATHGSPWRYDTHVPLLLFGNGVKPGKFARPVSPAAMAATVSQLLNIPRPANCIEPPAHEALAP